MTARRSRFALITLLSLGVLAPALTARADNLRFGLRGGYYTDAEGAFVGAELLARLAPRIYFNPNLEYVFVDGGRLSTWNADFHYDLPTHGSVYVWVGAGLALVLSDPDGPDNSESDVGANFLAGVGFGSGGVIPYFQIKGLARDGSGEFVVAFGLRF